MSLTGNNGLLAAAGANQPAYSIDESVRISEAGGLRRMQTGGNLRKFTFSTWVKPGNIDGSAAYEKCLYTAGNFGDGAGYTDFIYFMPFASGGRPIRMVVSASGALAGSIITSSFFNDPASWYHVVAVLDSANATGADRMIIYVNGTRQDIGTITTLPQNTDCLYFNANGKQAVIGNYAYYWDPSNPTHNQHATDGYMADTYFIDGSIVAPSVFAETDEDTNQWKPKDNSEVKSAVTFGTNGFYLNYSDSSSLGTDSSGQGNDFTPGNLVATDQVLDSPSNNFAT
ncbi:MAG: LamG domain-containing protein, partial [bacterium]|nr:LamG domain-containing protein [bacterium]